MPLASNLPVIDNRRYDDLVAELRTRIPRYTPEWTDFNDSDPGMTLVQLFAWLGDMLMYRMGQVPELNYLKFLELLGIELRAAEPAMAEISFPLTLTAPQPFVIIPRRTQVSAAAPVRPHRSCSRPIGRLRQLPRDCHPYRHSTDLPSKT